MQTFGHSKVLRLRFGFWILSGSRLMIACNELLYLEGRTVRYSIEKKIQIDNISSIRERTKNPPF